VDHRVVEPVAGETIDLVDQAVGDRVLLDVGQQLLQRGPICGLAALAGLHELFDDHGVQLVCLVHDGFALGGKREAFLTTSARGLVLGRHAEVGDCACRGGTGALGLSQCAEFGCHGGGSSRYGPTYGRCESRSPDNNGVPGER